MVRSLVVAACAALWSTQTKRLKSKNALTRLLFIIFSPTFVKKPIISENYVDRAAHFTDGYVTSNQMLNSVHVLPIQSSKWQVSDSFNDQNSIFCRASTVLYYTRCFIGFYILWTTTFNLSSLLWYKHFKTFFLSFTR